MALILNVFIYKKRIDASEINFKIPITPSNLDQKVNFLTKLISYI